MSVHGKIGKLGEKEENLPPIHPRKEKISLEDLPLIDPKKIDQLSVTLARKIDKEIFDMKYAPVKQVLQLIGTGALLAASFAAPNLPKALSSLYKNNQDYEVWKRFNIPYLKRTLQRLEQQKLVEIGEDNRLQVVTITDRGRRKILKYALEEIEVKKPKYWDRKWWLVSYDMPKGLSHRRDYFYRHLISWGFYPLHESVLMHAYSCYQEVDFLREYLGVGEFVRIIKVDSIEHDREFREFFGV